MRQKSVQELHASEAIRGANPTESEFSDVITEMLVYLDEQMNTLEFDPNEEGWRMIDSSEYDANNFQEVEADFLAGSMRGGRNTWFRTSPRTNSSPPSRSERWEL